MSAAAAKPKSKMTELEMQEVKKRKRVSEEPAAQEKNTEAQVSKKLYAMLMKSYLAPLSDENLKGKAMQIYSIAVLEGMQMMMLEKPMGTLEASELAEEAVFGHMESLYKEAHYKDGCYMLRQIIACEKSNRPMESLLGFVETENEQPIILGEKLGIVCKTSILNKTGGCIFKILRKINCFMQEHSFMSGKTAEESKVLLKRMTDDKIKFMLGRRVVCMTTNKGAQSKMGEEMDELKASKRAMEKEKRGIRDKIEAKSVEMDKLHTKMDETIAMLTQSLPEDGGEGGERTHMLNYLATMKRASNMALDEMVAVDKKEFGMLEQRLEEIEQAIKEKKEEMTACELLMGEDALRECVAAIYEKMESATLLCNIRKQVSELMGLPEVLQEARIHIFDKTKKSMDEMLHPPPPPLF